MYEPSWKQGKMQYLEEAHEGVLIQNMARGLSMEEVADFFGVSVEMLQGSEEDWNFFKYHYKMGRSKGYTDAVSSLFKQMDQRQGGQLCISYLARFAKEWDAEIPADKEGNKTKSFRVVLD